MIRVADTSWLTCWPVNPLSVGQVLSITLTPGPSHCSLQIVNNETSSRPANVRYQELDLPPDFPLLVRKFIPNINYQSLQQAGLPLRLVMLQVGAACPGIVLTSVFRLSEISRRERNCFLHISL